MKNDRKRISVAMVDSMVKWQMKVNADECKVMHIRKNSPNCT